MCFLVVVDCAMLCFCDVALVAFSALRVLGGPATVIYNKSNSNSKVITITLIIIVYVITIIIIIYTI